MRTRRPGGVALRRRAFGSRLTRGVQAVAPELSGYVRAMSNSGSSALRDAIAAATTRTWKHLIENFGEQDIYGSALYTNDVCQYITCTAFSEEGLATVVERYEGRASEGPAILRTRFPAASRG